MNPTKRAAWVFLAGLACAVTGCNPFSGTEKDADGDGHQAVKFGGDDCDDSDPSIHPGVEEVCNALDDDCDGLTDNGRDSDGDHHWVCDCDDADPDVHPGAVETCDGRDEDCDGQVDDGLGDRACPLSAGVCQGAVRRCLGPAGWSGCDYGPDFEAGAETRCDGLDNDCDGATDEDLTTVACQVENQWGACAGTRTCQGAQGYTACDAATPEAERCDGLDNDCDGQIDEGLLLFEPEAGAQAHDGIDNNCNGVADEPGGVMVEIPTFPGTWIDSFEVTIFDDPDCTGARYGEASDDYPAQWPPEEGATVQLYACSLPGLIPSGHLSFYRAERACQAQGKRLCTADEYRWACSMGSDDMYPYANIFVPNICNDPIAGAGAPVATGSRSECTNAQAPLAFDMSGNLAEWIDQDVGADPDLRMAIGSSWSCTVCDWGTDCQPCDLENDYQLEGLRKTSSCYVWDVSGTRYRIYRSFPRSVPQAWLGTRCCYP